MATKKGSASIKKVENLCCKTITSEFNAPRSLFSNKISDTVHVIIINITDMFRLIIAIII